MILGAVLLLVFSLATGATIPLTEISFKSWMVILYLVALGSVVAFAAFIYSMKKLPAAVASLYAYINPLVAMGAAAALLKEKLTMNIIWGSIVTLAGVFLVNYSIKRTREKVIAEAEL